ncbi:MAG: enoyl-CoA hydratase/isomerase family protein [Planctomycetes bacterium]|nr:enoyl-CoA hydratase/isomerase family protein [Planctomycetota bacterium]
METVHVTQAGPVATIALARPDVRNAFNEVVVAELREAFATLPAGVRAVVLTGEGPVFCAGADIGWMQRSRAYTEEENARDAAAMAEMFRTVDECPHPVLARVNGAALGGGAGLLACCDIVVASETAQFGFSEVRLGIVPGVISTFVLPRIGTRAARRYFLTGERFNATEARAIGLVHEVTNPLALDGHVERILKEVLLAGPEAAAAAKQLIREVAGKSRDEAIPHTVLTIARIRVSPEAQEGLAAFLEKRKPSWIGGA